MSNEYVALVPVISFITIFLGIIVYVIVSDHRQLQKLEDRTRRMIERWKQEDEVSLAQGEAFILKWESGVKFDPARPFGVWAKFVGTSNGEGLVAHFNDKQLAQRCCDEINAMNPAYKGWVVDYASFK